MTYPNTNITPQIGDVVKFIGEDSTMIVEDVIDSEEKFKFWGLQEKCIMMKSKKYGLLTDHLDEYSEVQFISRNKSKYFKK